MVYLENVFKLQGCKYSIGIELLRKANFDIYTMYEKDNELSIGLGAYSTIKVYDKRVDFIEENREQNFEVRNLSKVLEDIFKLINIENWRAYGMAKFGLARFNYGLPLYMENSHMMTFFIPKVEIRLSSSEIKLRALYKNDFLNYKKLIEDTMDKVKHMSIENFEIDTKSNLEIHRTLNLDSEEYKDKVKEAVAQIRDKKYEKVILSRKINLNKRVDIFSTYLAGRKVNTPARSFITNIDGLSTVGFSPETVAEIDSEGVPYTYPLAGTRSRGRDEKEELELKKELLSDIKEIAEHAVSVKLAFEELELVCDHKSIVVNEFMNIAKRGTVQHIASRLRGKISEQYNHWDALNTLFPAVTASGIPKRESIDALGKIEGEARDLYSGSIIVYDSTGEMDATLVLRTVYQNKKETWLRVGAGIVRMSTPERELEETKEKLSSFAESLVYIDEGVS